MSSGKNMLNHFYELPTDVQLRGIERKVSLETFRAIEAALVKHDNNMKDYSLVVDQCCITANHSNYLVCDEDNTRSVTVRKVVKRSSITAMPRN